MGVLIHFDWFRNPNKVISGCHELGKCPTPWWIGPFLFGYLLGPAILFASANSYAWRRWTLKRWILVFFSCSALAVALYFLDALVK